MKEWQIDAIQIISNWTMEQIYLMSKKANERISLEKWKSDQNDYNSKTGKVRKWTSFSEFTGTMTARNIGVENGKKE